MPRKTTMTDQIYEYLCRVIPTQGYAPSVREIGEAMGLKSPSTVHFHLKRLQERGLIAKSDGKGRALVLTGRSEPNRIPVLGDVAAGAPILAQERIEDYLTIDGDSNEGEYFAVRVQGESMRNAGILPGDLVVVHRQQTANHGEIVVALLDDEATVKRLSCKDDTVWLLPENDAYQPIDGTNATILGKVTTVIRRYP